MLKRTGFFALILSGFLTTGFGQAIGDVHTPGKLFEVRGLVENAQIGVEAASIMRKPDRFARNWSRQIISVEPWLYIHFICKKNADLSFTYATQDMNVKMFVVTDHPLFYSAYCKELTRQFSTPSLIRIDHNENGQSQQWADKKRHLTWTLESYTNIGRMTLTAQATSQRNLPPTLMIY